MVEAAAEKLHASTRVELEEIEQSIISHGPGAEAPAAPWTRDRRRRRRRRLIDAVRAAVRLGH
ncbi:hypothetical protein CF15_08020 [Pyrodictium occultum]|uniref:Uncharacterized protein n=2 Tax=Pyrodictium occultum TaxID=2309 RepID=A0A0V8RRN4_PYROC|nr:hypothetical protein CF15_08020 [Pyrodictium occultum]